MALYQSGFTFVEVAVVLGLVALLLSFSVPRFRDAVERTRAAQAIQFLTDVRFAQERHQGALGEYARDIKVLELTAPIPDRFDLGRLLVEVRGRIAVGWALTLTRKVDGSPYGAYTVRFTQRGYDSVASSLSAISEISPLEDPLILQP